jgi:polyhydroxybutyrate depolymerase
MFVSSLLLLLAGCGNSAAPDVCADRGGGAGVFSVEIRSGGLAREFSLVVPESALTGQPAPLVVGYHGANATPEAFLAVTELPQAATRRGLIVAAGLGVGLSWNGGVCCGEAAAEGIDDVQFTRDMIARIAEEYCIDEERILVSGFSAGGVMAAHLACEAPEIAATTAVVGAWNVGCALPADTSFWIANMTDDPLVPYGLLGSLLFPQFTEPNQCNAARVPVDLAANANCEAATVCVGAAPIQNCAVSGVGHHWPGGLTQPAGPFAATPAMLDFFLDPRD